MPDQPRQEPLVLSDLLDDGVLLLVLNKPERLNAYSTQMGQEYLDLMERAGSDPGVRSIVVTGAGRAFCAGADSAVLEGLGDGGLDPALETTRQPHSLPMLVPKPVIAAINGGCAGFGFVTASYCDVRFAAAGAKITTAFARRGLIAEYGMSWILPRLLGHGNARDLLLSGRTVLAEEAQRLGWVQQVHQPEALLPAALAYARDLALNTSPASIAVMKQQLLHDATADLDDALTRADVLMLRSFAGADFREGVASWTERRAPRFAALGDS